MAASGEKNNFPVIHTLDFAVFRTFPTDYQQIKMLEIVEELERNSQLYKTFGMSKVFQWCC